MTPSSSSAFHSYFTTILLLFYSCCAAALQLLYSFLQPSHTLGSCAATQQPFCCLSTAICSGPALAVSLQLFFSLLLPFQKYILWLYCSNCCFSMLCLRPCLPDQHIYQLGLFSMQNAVFNADYIFGCHITMDILLFSKQSCTSPLCAAHITKPMVEDEDASTMEN